MKKYVWKIREFENFEFYPENWFIFQRKISTIFIFTHFVILPESFITLDSAKTCPQSKNSKNYRSDVIHKITHSNPTLFQSYTFLILHSYNPTLLQSYTLPILHPSNPTPFQSYTLTIIHPSNPTL